MILVHETSFNILIHFPAKKKIQNLSEHHTIQEIKDTIQLYPFHHI